MARWSSRTSSASGRLCILYSRYARRNPRYNVTFVTWKAKHACCFLIHTHSLGLLDLYEASGKERYLMLAIKLQGWQDRLFWDENNGGYFTSVADEHILLRSKDAQVGLLATSCYHRLLICISL